MPLIQLPNNQSAVIAGRDEITERTNRAIAQAYMKAAGTAAKLASLGFDDNDPKTWGIFADISEQDQANLNGYQAQLIVGLVKQWTLGDLPTLESALDLPKAVFDALSEACGIEFNGSVVNVEPDPDPKVPTAD